ncbi:ANTAR domain-containing protein [Cellulosimicrobium terreum]|nr:ANTAR domain-containing protein [Cellulosimicrobium terreum]
MTIADFPRELAVRAATVLGSGLEVSVTVRELGVSVRAGSSSEAAARCDSVEALADAGPCITAIEQLHVQLVPDISTETRWTRWREQAVAEGFASSAGVPAPVSEGIAVALNLYSREPGTWSAELLDAADSYARLTAAALRLRLELSELEDAAVGLYRDLTDSLAVERAVGAIMQTNSCSEADARRVVESAARHRGLSPRAVAETIVRSLIVPDGPEDGVAR